MWLILRCKISWTKLSVSDSFPTAAVSTTLTVRNLLCSSMFVHLLSSITVTNSVQMVAAYVNSTNDVTILPRALPLMEAELYWWETNRSINITSPYSSKTFTMTRYAVGNTAPRPESYIEDYETANGADLATPYTDQQKADLYAELASGAETGWDYSSRWEKNPFPAGENLTNNNPGLRTLNVRSTIPVDLNSILCK